MATIESITERLFRKADEQLDRDMDAAFNESFQALNNGNVFYDAMCDSDRLGRWAYPSNPQGPLEVAQCGKALQIIKGIAKEALRPKYRDRAIKDFMKEVETLKDRVEELESSVNR